MNYKSILLPEKAEVAWCGSFKKLPEKEKEEGIPKRTQAVQRSKV